MYIQYHPLLSPLRIYLDTSNFSDIYNPKPNTIGKPRGYAFIEFSKEEEMRQVSPPPLLPFPPSLFVSF
jgi:hypothetical protein